MAGGFLAALTALLSAVRAGAYWDVPEFCERRYCKAWVIAPSEPSFDFLKTRAEAEESGPFCKTLGDKCFRVSKEDDCELAQTIWLFCEGLEDPDEEDDDDPFGTINFREMTDYGKPKRRKRRGGKSTVVRRRRSEASAESEAEEEQPTPRRRRRRRVEAESERLLTEAADGHAPRSASLLV